MPAGGAGGKVAKMYTINVTHYQEIIPAILESWDEITDADIKGAAELLYYGFRNDPPFEDETGEADLVECLRICKASSPPTTLKRAVKLWRRIECPDTPYGGLVHGEDSPNSAKVKQVIDAMFLQFLPKLIDNEFDRLALAASRVKDPEKRCSAYQSARYNFENDVDSIALTQTAIEDVAKMMSAKTQLFEQLITEAEEMISEKPAKRRKSPKS